MEISFKFDDKAWNAFIERIRRNLSPSMTSRILELVAYSGLRRVVHRMPKKTGALKRSWRVDKLNMDSFAISSDSKVAKFLEEGTRAHGPKTAKYLYIPLRRGATVWRKGLVFGQDYILTKRVKGIKAMRYLKPISNDILQDMVEDFSKYLGGVNG